MQKIINSIFKLNTGKTASNGSLAMSEEVLSLGNINVYDDVPCHDEDYDRRRRSSFASRIRAKHQQERAANGNMARFIPRMPVYHDHPRYLYITALN